MNTETKVYTYPNGEIQRVQMVRWENWSQLDFLYPKADAAALTCFADIYRNFLVPACPWIFPQMIMFALPDDFDIAEYIENDADAVKMSENPSSQQKNAWSYKTKRYGEITDVLMIVSALLQEGIRLKHGNPMFLNDRAEKLYRRLEACNSIRIVCGKMPYTKVIPIRHCTGYLSEAEKDAQMKVNASFFIMDPIDCATIYDQVGTIFGLCVKNGVVQNPPLFHREAFLVKKDGSVSIKEMDIRDLSIEINGCIYQHGKNATIYTRPERKSTPGGTGLRMVVVGNRIVAVKHGGKVDIPASGFVLCIAEQGTNRTYQNGMQAVERKSVSAGMEVIYHGLEDIEFGIQVGNSIIRDGVPTDHFISKFYNIYHLEPVPYPPSLYPMNFEKARAARIALGADANGKPMLFWAEGAGKFGAVQGVDSTGASLKEMAEIATDFCMKNAVNLDGGGSAQILLKNQRMLHISDRKKEDNSDAERLVPLGLMVR